MLYKPRHENPQHDFMQDVENTLILAQAILEALCISIPVFVLVAMQSILGILVALMLASIYLGAIFVYLSRRQ